MTLKGITKGFAKTIRQLNEFIRAENGKQGVDTAEMKRLEKGIAFSKEENKRAFRIKEKLEEIIK